MHCLNKLRQQWQKFRKQGFYRMLLVEERRDKRRNEKGRTKLMDIFLYSNSDDYYTLRLFYNFPIGFGIALAVYVLAWYKINFAISPLIDAFWGEFVKWFMIGSAASAYALNPLVRASLACALLSGLSSWGQGLIAVYVVKNLSGDEGPLENIIQNFNVSTRITICHLELQAKITKRRVELQAGPIETLFEKNFGNATSIGKKIIKSLKSLIQPFDEDVEEDNEEDKHLEAIIDTAKQLADRQLLTEGEDPAGVKVERAARPAWKRLKSQLGRAIAHRFERRCKYMFASSMDSCHKKFEESQSICYDSIPFPIDFFACSRMNALTLCQPGKVGAMSTKFCELGQGADASREEHETLFSPELDEQMSDMQNVTKQIERQLQLNLHFQAVEQPEIERGYTVNQLMLEVKHDVKMFKVTLDTMRLVIDFLLVWFTYFVFSGSVRMTLQYLNDIEHKNFFTTRYFWHIDAKRKGEQKVYLQPLRKQERKDNKTTSPYGLPRPDEISQSIKSFVRWGVLAFIVAIVLLVDHYLFRMLEIVVNHGEITRHQIGAAELYIDVNGTGPIAELLRKVLNMNYSQHLDEHWSNEHCLDPPNRPDWPFALRFLVAPLLAMLTLQVFFNFVIQRLVLFYVLGLMFPRRAKARVIHLYNKIMFARVNLDRMEALKRKVEAEDAEQERREKEAEEEG